MTSGTIIANKHCFGCEACRICFRKSSNEIGVQLRLRGQKKIAHRRYVQKHSTVLQKLWRNSGNFKGSRRVKQYRLSYKYIRPRVGAPPGLTVHWLIAELAGDFTRAYRLSYNQKNHNYHFARYRKKTMIDEFIVIRTSKRCYRVMYFNEDFKHFQYFSAGNYRECAGRMISIFNVFKQIENVEKPRKTKKPPKEVEKSLSEVKSENIGNTS